ncbi:hypothetical protein EMCRGX_G014598 [Ephydatia muelleri]
MGETNQNEKRFAPSTNYKAKSAKEMCPRALLTLSLLAMILFVSGKTGSVKAPNYIMDLYRCVRDKTPLDCYGVEADSVQSIGGKVAPSNSVSRLPNSSVLINFNLTATNEESNGNDAVMAAKLRVYKNQLTDEKILALRASGCNTSAITLQLFAVGGKTTAESLANVTLTRDDLRTGKWLTFGNLAGTYRQWIKNATSNVQSLAVVAVGTCSASALGFDVDSATLNPPLLVAFIRSSDQNMDFITKGLGEATVSRVQTRDVASNNNPCQLHTYQVITSNEWRNYIEPDTFEANFCAGVCDVPDSTNLLYTTQHAQLQYYLNKRYPSQVPAPCCVPKDFGNVSFVVQLDDRGSTEIKTISNLSAKNCQCR